MKSYNLLKESKYVMFIDTETIGSINCKESVLPFEIGMKVYNLETNQYVVEKSYLVRRFFNNKFIMLSSFSASKYPNYFEKLDNDKRYKLYSPKAIATDLEKVINKYNISCFVAHNAQFDKLAIARLFNEFAIDNPLDNVDYIDTIELSKCITKSNSYKRFCLKNKDVLDDLKQSCFITNGGRVKTTAQAIYCYLIKDTSFQEKHTGLEDIDIEKEIFLASVCYKGTDVESIKVNTTPNWREFDKVC